MHYLLIIVLGLACTVCVTRAGARAWHLVLAAVFGATLSGAQWVPHALHLLASGR